MENRKNLCGTCHQPKDDHKAVVAEATNVLARLFGVKRTKTVAGACPVRLVAERRGVVLGRKGERRETVEVYVPELPAPQPNRATRRALGLQAGAASYPPGVQLHQVVQRTAANRASFRSPAALAKAGA